MTYDSFVQGKPLPKRLLPATEMTYDNLSVRRPFDITQETCPGSRQEFSYD